MKRLIFFVFSIGLLAFLLWKAGTWTILAVLRNSKRDWLMIAMGFYLVSYIGRALRFRSLLRRSRCGFQSLVQIVCWHNLCNHLLPARTGELSFVYLVRKRKLDTAVSGLSTLIACRIFDGMAVLLFLSAGLLLQPVNIFGMRPPFLWLIALVTLLALASSLYRFSSLLTWLAERIDPFLKAFHVTRFAERLREAAAEFRRMQSGVLYRRSLAWTLFLWTFQFLTFYALMRSFHVLLSFWAILIGAGVAALAGFIPSATGNFGPLEAGWALGFALVGLKLHEGLATGFAMHVAVLGFACTFAAAALLLSIPWIHGEGHAAASK
jgi:glycosyltransferase 2 family protein